jgi:hypothetical protein
VGRAVLLPRGGERGAERRRNGEQTMEAKTEVAESLFFHARPRPLPDKEKEI